MNDLLIYAGVLFLAWRVDVGFDRLVRAIERSAVDDG